MPGTVIIGVEIEATLAEDSEFWERLKFSLLICFRFEDDNLDVLFVDLCFWLFEEDGWWLVDWVLAVGGVILINGLGLR